MIDLVTLALQAISYLAFLLFVALIIGSAIAAVRPLARRIRKGNRRTADGLIAAGAVVGIGITLAVLLWLFSGLGETSNQIFLINDSSEEVVLEQSLRQTDAVDLRFARSESETVRVRSTGGDGARCTTSERQRLLRLNPGIEPTFPDSAYPFRAAPLDPADYEVLAELAGGICFPGRNVWLAWDGTELRQVGEPGIPEEAWIMIVAGLIAAGCVALGFAIDRGGRGHRDATKEGEPLATLGASQPWQTSPPTGPPPMP